jgi:hypothetical protein
MRSQPLPQAESSRDIRLRLRSGRNVRRLIVSASLCAGSFFFSGALVTAQANTAQTSPAPAPASTPTHKSVHLRKKPAAAVVAPAPQPAPPPAPVLPPPPDWPANDLPVAASVVYDSRGLLVVASNSSLAQILKEVSIDTGAKLEGMGADPGTLDQRIYGTYGPGPARDVLNQLLDGSGYNVLLIGDRGQGTPRRIVLSPQSGSAMPNTAHNAPTQPSADDNESDQSPPEAEQEQPPPQPVQNGSAPPVPVRTPQQMMQERDRQQQQMQNGQQNPQN